MKTAWAFFPNFNLNFTTRYIFTKLFVLIFFLSLFAISLYSDIAFWLTAQKII